MLRNLARSNIELALYINYHAKSEVKGAKLFSDFQEQCVNLNHHLRLNNHKIMQLSEHQGSKSTEWTNVG